jgi:alpha-beta hydrolase superfamily lysophospholipase
MYATYRLVLFAFVAAACFLLAACSTLPPPDPTEPFRNGLRSELGPLDPAGAGWVEHMHGPFSAEYMHEYGWDRLAADGLQVRLGLVPWRAGSLGVVLLTPRGRPRGTIIFAHGYLSHTGSFRGVLEPFVRAGFSVAAFDLPGHGFSDGERGAIADFELYGSAVTDLTGYLAASDPLGLSLPRPWYAIGHSTGATAFFIHLSRNPVATRFERLVLITPLVRSAYWELSMLGLALSGWIMRHAEPFGGYERLLGIRRFPMTWVESLRAWNDIAENYLPIDTPTLLIQGADDQVVDHRFNLAWFRRHIRQLRIVEVPGAGHIVQQDQVLQSAFLEQALLFLY